MESEQKFYLGMGGLALLAFVTVFVGPQGCIKRNQEARLECIKAGGNPTECSRAFSN